MPKGSDRKGKNESRAEQSAVQCILCGWWIRIQTGFEWQQSQNEQSSGCVLH